MHSAVHFKRRLVPEPLERQVQQLLHRVAPMVPRHLVMQPPPDPLEGIAPAPSCQSARHSRDTLAGWHAGHLLRWCCQVRPVSGGPGWVAKWRTRAIRLPNPPEAKHFLRGASSPPPPMNLANSPRVGGPQGPADDTLAGAPARPGRWQRRGDCPRGRPPDCPTWLDPLRGGRLQ